MSKNAQPSLLVAVVGMDDRTRHMLQLFFQGPCKNSCAIVEDGTAEVSIVDMDAHNAELLYQQQRDKFPEHRFILLSLTEREDVGSFFVKKPLQPKALLSVLDLVRKGGREAQKAEGVAVLDSLQSAEKSEIVKKPVRKSSSNSAHHSAMQLDEKSFISFIGALKNIDLDDKEQVNEAHYDPKNYLQGYFQSACKVALNKNQILQLDGSWKPLIIFPRTNEVWLDAEDKQLQAACRVPLRVLNDVDPAVDGKGSGMTVSVVSGTGGIGAGDSHKFQNIDSFLWKVSLWTSQGRVPLGIDLARPVYLRHWPNMTRLMLFPHAMRISALMMDGPRPMLEIARVLNVPQQYVFAFYSAARALGIAGQVKRQADVIVAPQPVQKPKQRGLFGKILDRLKLGK